MLTKFSDLPDRMFRINLAAILDAAHTIRKHLYENQYICLYLICFICREELQRKSGDVDRAMDLTMDKMYTNLSDDNAKSIQLLQMSSESIDQPIISMLQFAEDVIKQYSAEY